MVQFPRSGHTVDVTRDILGDVDVFPQQPKGAVVVIPLRREPAALAVGEGGAAIGEEPLLPRGPVVGQIGGVGTASRIDIALESLRRSPWEKVVLR
jgi:hypothetical protein